MNKIIILLISVFLTSFHSFSQNWDEVKNNREVYMWGIGHGKTVEEADGLALNDLSSNICVHISGVTIDSLTNKVINGDAETYSHLSSVIQAYSNATLCNTQRQVLSFKPNVSVVRWIKRDEVDKIFEHRKQKIKEYVSSGIKAIENGKIDVALKDFHWALALTQSLQYPTEAKYELIEGDPLSSVLLTVWLPEQIKELLQNIKIDAVNRTDDIVELLITYKDKPVSSLDYKYFDGNDFSYIYSAKDGKGIIELPPNDQSEHYQLHIEYEYRSQSQIDEDIRNALTVIQYPINNVLKVKSKLTDKREKKLAKSKDNITFSNISPEFYSRPNTVKNTAKYEEILRNVASAISSKKYSQVEQFFSPECLACYNRLIKYGKAKVIGTPKYSFYPYRDRIIARGLKMSFSFGKSGRKSFVENVVFSFNKEGKIDNITFGLDETVITDILCMKSWNETSRMAIVNFLENYQTAYALRDSNYIERIFDDDAVIITATVIHRPQRSSEGNEYSDNQIIRYNRHSKDSYLKKLRSNFDKNEYINIRFSDIMVKRPGNGNETYGIQISQEYYSSNYGDKGYLFLLVDLNSPEEPLIKIRTWQPEKDPDFGMYDYTDF